MIRRDIRSGVTVLELLLAAALLVVAGSAIASVWFASDRGARVGATVAEVQAEARRAMTTLERDIRAGAKNTVDLDDVNDVIAFCTFEPGDETPRRIRYALNVDTQELIRSDLTAGTDRVVARRVGTFEITTATGGSVTVLLDIALAEIGAPLQTEVAFRTTELLPSLATGVCA